jgi:Pseudouridylate synthases, 23S RNA-specific
MLEDTEIRVLHDTGKMLFVYKPPGWSCENTTNLNECSIEECKKKKLFVFLVGKLLTSAASLANSYNACNRLDRYTSGAVVFSKYKKYHKECREFICD